MANAIFPQTISNFTPAQIVTADASALKTIVTPGANGCIVDNILIHSTDTSARDVQLVVTKSSVDYPLGTVSIPANSGNTNALAPINILQSTLLLGLTNDNNGNKILKLENGSVLKIKSLTTLTAAKAISIFPQGSGF